MPDLGEATLLQWFEASLTAVPQDTQEEESQESQESENRRWNKNKGRLRLTSLLNLNNRVASKGAWENASVQTVAPILFPQVNKER